jgi:hypothetical protein
MSDNFLSEKHLLEYEQVLAAPHPNSGWKNARSCTPSGKVFSHIELAAIAGVLLSEVRRLRALIQKLESK